MKDNIKENDNYNKDNKKNQDIKNSNFKNYTFDPFGSYTGNTPSNTDPVQDADDL